MRTARIPRRGRVGVRGGVTKAQSEKIFQLYGGFSSKVEFKDSPPEDKTPITTCYKIVTGERYPEIVKQFSKATFSLGACDKENDEARISHFVNYFQNKKIKETWPPRTFKPQYEDIKDMNKRH